MHMTAEFVVETCSGIPASDKHRADMPSCMAWAKQQHCHCRPVKKELAKLEKELTNGKTKGANTTMTK